MRVGVHRDPDLAVAERLHHHAGVVPCRDEQRGAGMAQIVEADIGQPGPLEERLEGTDDVARLERGAAPRGEDQSPVRPRLLCSRALGTLLCEVYGERASQRVRQWECPAATPCLRLSE